MSTLDMNKALACALISLLIIAAAACLHAAVVGTEVRVCASYDAAPGIQENADIAAGAGLALIVWQDRRGSDLDIFASRVSESGALLDPAGIAICTAAGDQTEPAVAWNGRDFLVVWSDKRSSGAQHIYGTRVRATGEVIDPQGLLLSGTANVQAYPRVAASDLSWFVVWQESRTASFDIYSCVVTPDGGTSVPLGVATRTDNELYPDVAWNGYNYVVVWSDCRNMQASSNDIYGCRVGKNGIRLANDMFISCTSTGSAGAAGIQTNPRVRSFGSTCMVVWEDYRNSSSIPNIYGSRVTSGGTVSDKGGIAICSGSSAGAVPSVAYNGNRLLVVWRDYSGHTLRGVRLTTAGSLLTPAFQLSNGPAGSDGCGASALGSVFFCTWNTVSATDSDCRLSRVSDGGTVADAGSLVSSALSDEGDYAVADNGTEYAVVWSQKISGKFCIMGARVSRAGQLLNETAVNLTGTFAGNQREPAIAWNGSKYLLTWSDDATYSSTQRDIRGCRLQSNLTRIDGSPITICQSIVDQVRPTVASNGSKFLVAWEDSRLAVSPYYYSDIYGALVDTNGVVSAISVAISGAIGNQKRPKAASDRTNFFVVWEDYRNDYPLVYGSRVTSTGTVSDTSGIKFPGTSYYQLTPAICYGQSQYLVTWSDLYTITGCRVATSGSLLDTNGIMINGGSAYRSCPGACWDGTQFQVCWEDYRSSYPGNADVYQTAVSAAGVVSPYPESALVSDLLPTLRPTIFMSSSGGMLLYSKYENYANCVCAATLTDSTPQDVSTISDAKQLAIGSLVSLRGKIVTAAFNGYFYVQEQDRTSGIKVVSAIPVEVGEVVDVSGPMSVSDGERQIGCNVLSPAGVMDNPPAPLGIRGDYLGGGPMNSYTPGITGACGLNNIGLLVKTWGKVTSVGSGYFILQAKPMVNIKVKCGSLATPAVNKFVEVTGISSCEIDSGAITRALRVRTQSDIQVIN